MSNSCGCNGQCHSDTETIEQDAPETLPVGTMESIYHVPKMDCPAEEGMVRMVLDGVTSVQFLLFDLPGRSLTVYHTGEAAVITEKLVPLGYGAELVSTSAVEGLELPEIADEGAQAKTLRMLLVINAVMFVVEIVMGIYAQSTGLIADSLDMFADAAVYGISLYAVGKAAAQKLKAAHLSGWFQFILAAGALSEVLRRAVFGGEPESGLMMSIAALALVANAACVYLLMSHRKGEAHMQASWIFTTNDVIANAGVILAGALVGWTGSQLPDLVIGTIIGLLVLNGARKILKLR